MTPGRVIRVRAHYRDPGIVERIAANFRRLWVDVEWIQGSRVDQEWYEVYLGLGDSKNLDLAILNLSKTVGVESVEVLEDARVDRRVIPINGNKGITVYVPVYSKVTRYSWGEVSG